MQPFEIAMTIISALLGPGLVFSDFFLQSATSDKDIPSYNIPTLLGEEWEDWFNCGILIQRKYEEPDEVCYN